MDSQVHLVQLEHLVVLEDLADPEPQVELDSLAL